MQDTYQFEPSKQPLEISGPPVAFTDNLDDWFDFHGELGRGGSGLVVAVSIKTAALVIFPSYLTAGVVYALKLQPGASLEEPAAQTEARISVLIRAAALPKLNLAASLFWARVIPDKSALFLGAIGARAMVAAPFVHLNLMHYYSAGSLSKLVLGSVAPYYTQSYAMLLQIVVAMAQLRTIIPDFKHNDLHPGNVFLDREDTPGLTIIYSYKEFEFVVPLFLTGGHVLNLGDFGSASGSYKTVAGKDFQIGSQRRNRVYDLTFIFSIFPFPSNWDRLPFLRIDDEMKPTYYEELLVSGAFGAFLGAKDNEKQRREAYDYLWKQTGQSGVQPNPVFTAPIPVSLGPRVFVEEIKSRRK